MAESPTIPALFQATIARVGDQAAVAIIRDGQLSWRTWLEIQDDVLRIVAKLRANNVSAGDRVVHWAPNSYEWIVTDLAILSMGAVHVPLHATLPAIQAAEQVELADAKLLIVDDARVDVGQQFSIPSIAAKMLLATDEVVNKDVRESLTATHVRPQDLATILFTSGTTGRPRGVMLTHDNLATNAIATTEGIASPHENETRLCFLPLSHIFARTCDLYTWIYRGTRLAIAESRETILRDCQLAHPTVINAVPYFFQKVAQAIRAAGKAGQPGAATELLGGRILLCLCGGAAASPELERFFVDQGLPLLAGYGLTEASPVIANSNRNNFREGHVGPPLRDVEVRISDDGELLVRGPNVMLGYWRDEQATREAIVDGWLHTGDLAELDAEGRIRIVGRRKELIVLSTGKNVCPTVVEQRLTGSPYIELACVVGEGQTHLGALIVPNPQALQKFIRNERLWVWSKQRAVTHPKVRGLFRAEIDRCLSDAVREEQVGPFVILTRNFSLEDGEITPKFSLCREVIAKNLTVEIAAMYRANRADNAGHAWPAASGLASRLLNRHNRHHLHSAGRAFDPPIGATYIPLGIYRSANSRPLTRGRPRFPLPSRSASATSIMEEPEQGSPASEDRSQKTAAALRALREGLGSKLETHRRRITDLESDLTSRVLQIAEEMAHDQAAESQAELQVHDDRVRKLREVVTERDATIANLQRQLSDAELLQLRLSAELAASRSSGETVRGGECRDYDSLRSQIATANEKAAADDATIVRLEARIAELQGVLESTHRALELLRDTESAECEQLSRELTEQQQQIVAAGELAVQLESRVETLTQELEQARDAEKKLHAQHTADNAAYIKAQLTAAQVQQLLGERTAELAAAAERESQAAGQIEELLKQLESLATELTESRDVEARLIAQNTASDAAIAASQTSAAEMQELLAVQAAELAAAAERESQAKTQIDELLAQVSALTQDLDKAREAETRFTAQQSENDSTLTELQHALAEAQQSLQDRAAELEEATKQKSQADSRIDELQFNLTEVQQSLKDCALELDDATERETQANARLEELVGQVDVLTKELSAAQAFEAELQTLHSADDTALAESRRAAEETKRLLDERTAELAAAKERETAVNSRIETLLAQVESLTVDLTTAREAESKLLAQHSANDAALAESQDSAAETQQRLKEASAQLAATAVREEQANARIDELAAQIESLTNELTSARAAEFELREQHSSDDAASAEARLAAEATQKNLQAELTELAAERESLTRELAHARTELAARAESATNEVSWLQKEREAAEQSRNQLAADFEELLKQQKSTEEALADAELKNDQSNALLAKAEERIVELTNSTEDEIEQARKKFELALADAQKLKRENAELQEELARRPEVAETESPELVSLRVERDALAARVAELEAVPAQVADEDQEQRVADLQRRFEMAVEDLRHFKQENAQLHEKLTHAPPASHGGGTSSHQAMDWQSQKARLLAALESEDADDQTTERRTELVTIEGTISITDRVVADKDREIAELRGQLADRSFEVVEQSVEAATLDKDELIAAERAKLQALQNEWREKLRTAELEMSVQRATLARKEAEFEHKLQAAQQAQADPVVGADGKPRRRWLSALGLRDEDEKDGKK